MVIIFKSYFPSYLILSSFHWPTYYSNSSENAAEISSCSAIPGIRNWQEKIRNELQYCPPRVQKLINKTFRTGLITRLLLENENELNFQWSPAHPEAP